MKKTKKIIVIAPLLLLLIAGIFFAFNVVKNLGDKKSNEVEMANKKLFIVAEDSDWKIGEWTVTGNISAQTENLDVTDSEILLTPDGNQAKAKLTLTGNLYAESLAEDIEPGSLYFEFSRSILPDSDYSLYEIIDMYNSLKNSAIRDYIYFTIVYDKKSFVIKCKMYTNLSEVLNHLEILPKKIIVNGKTSLQSPHFLLDENIFLINIS